MLRVVKLGGSLYGEPELRAWLRALGEARGRVVVVPGGGPFADTVRTAQGHWHFPDADAHHMALLAMEQYGLMLCALDGGLVPARDVGEIGAARADYRTPVWLPTTLCLGDPELTQDWSVTSDSLAVWLATRLGTHALALVKHGTPARGDPAGLMDDGWVDAAFPALVRAWGGDLRIFARHELQAFRSWHGDPHRQRPANRPVDGHADSAALRAP